MLNLETIEKYKRLFQINIPLDKFSSNELKRRWKILVKKYHPDKGGNSEHFRFVQDAYSYLKNYTNDNIDSNDESEKLDKNEVIPGLRCYETKNCAMWDVGEADLRKRAIYKKKFSHQFKGNNLNVRI